MFPEALLCVLREILLHKTQVLSVTHGFVVAQSWGMQYAEQLDYPPKRHKLNFFLLFINFFQKHHVFIKTHFTVTIRSDGVCLDGCGKIYCTLSDVLLISTYLYNVNDQSLKAYCLSSSLRGAALQWVFVCLFVFFFKCHELGY